MNRALAFPVAALLIAGCGNAHASPHPAAASASVTSVIARASAAECARIGAVDKAITSGTVLDLTTGEIAGSMHAEGIAWGNALTRAASPAAGVPSGMNRANVIAVAIGAASVGESLVGLDAADGQYAAIGKDWRALQRQLTRARKACAA